jgi:NADPH-dependent 2,4-dienoyl-CoA reductase/sulfur reductase-like enzyme
LRVVVIGGGAAGMAAASRIKRLQPKWDVTVFEASKYVSHAPCGIPFHVAGYVESLDDLCAYDVSFFREDRGIDVRTGSRVIEAGDGYVIVERRGEVEEHGWDYLLIATGTRPAALNADCHDLKGVMCVGSIEDSVYIKERAKKAKNVIIVGSGYLGIEMADAMLRLHKRVTVIEMGSHPLPEYDVEIGELLRRNMEKLVEFRGNEKVVEIDGGAGRVVTDRSTYRGDLIILCMGVVPNVELAAQLGVKIGDTGAIWTDEYLRTTVDGVYAAGDCAETTNIVTGRKDWIPLAAPANKMGYVAGSNISGLDLAYPGSLKSQLTSFLDLEIGKAGLSEKEALREGYDVVSATVISRARAKYIPDGKSITLKMVAERNGRVLGVQAAGVGVSKRIYGASALLYKGATVEDFFFTDFPFYPPKSPVWDPLVIAARNLFRKLGIS